MPELLCDAPRGGPGRLTRRRCDHRSAVDDLEICSHGVLRCEPRQVPDSKQTKMGQALQHFLILGISKSGEAAEKIGWVPE
eukprot:s2018_g17.t1